MLTRMRILWWGDQSVCRLCCPSATGSRDAGFSCHQGRFSHGLRNLWSWAAREQVLSPAAQASPLGTWGTRKGESAVLHSQGVARDGCW